ncbi:hypothetical protein GGR56DRAFT_669447 [Xylariaceae sp. FL0804]|nr:hypothetical protein GGR56DRAFT_669447 [Xylariaceae sp. FL0804]
MTDDEPPSTATTTTTTTTTPAVTISLSRATADDVPALVAIAGRAFRTDAHTQMKAAAAAAAAGGQQQQEQSSASASAPTAAFEVGIAEGLRQWIALPERCAVLKATMTMTTMKTDEEEEEEEEEEEDPSGGSEVVVGYVQWAFRGVAVDDDEAALSTATATATVAAQRRRGGGEGGGQQEEEKNEEEDKGDNDKSSSSPRRPDADTNADADADAAARVAALERMTSEHLAAFQARVMPEGTRLGAGSGGAAARRPVGLGTECLYVGGLCVDPPHGGRGVGSALLRWGTARADRAGVFCWVHSSEAGWPTFARHGFEVVDRLTVDLDEWAAPRRRRRSSEGGEVAEEKRAVWGEYTFRYMVRQPRRP